jgi:hypothetical protein
MRESTSSSSSSVKMTSVDTTGLEAPIRVCSSAVSCHDEDGPARLIARPNEVRRLEHPFIGGEHLARRDDELEQPSLPACPSHP